MKLGAQVNVSILLCFSLKLWIFPLAFSKSGLRVVLAS